MQVVATWSGGHADLLRQAFRMTNESYAEYLSVSVRTVANWRGNPVVIPRPAIQDILDAALERAPDRVKAQFALLIGEAETSNQEPGHVEAFEASLNAASNVDIEGSELLESMRVIQGSGMLCGVYLSQRRAAIKGWPARERIELPHLIQRTGHRVYHITGFDREEIIDLCIRINSVERGTGTPVWPPCLGLFKSVAATLTYMRHNRTQAEIGESLGVSQPTISRAVAAITPLIPEAVREFVPTADDLDPDAQYILDGTLLTCWSWAGHKELYSGKHKTTGMNVQVACTIYGKLAWISDPVDGSRHDNYCQEESGVLLTMNPKNWIGDKGYIGNNIITPYRKPAGGELLDWQKEYNTQVNKIRWMIEQVISHLKNWTIMHTDYRRPLGTFTTTISAVVGLHFYRMA
jgi:transcriptional regulator with XRE-family HTH domain